MKYENLCRKIIEYVGGKENINNVTHCMTRLRFTLKDASIAKTNEIKALDKVVDVVSNEISYQIIIGVEVADIFVELSEMLSLNTAAQETSSKGGIFKNILNVISDSITPILPGMVTVGLISAVLSIFTVVGLLSPESSTFVIFDSIRTSMFYFLSFFVAVSASKRLNAPTTLALLLAATVLSPTINGVEGLTLFGIPLQTVEYSNTFIPILMGVWFMSLVNKQAKKFVPDALQYYFVPLIVMLICVPVTLCVFGPIGSVINWGMKSAVVALMDHVGTWSVLAIYSALIPFLIMFGAGNFAIPLSIELFSTFGYDPVFVQAYIFSDIAVCGTMLGYMIKSKSKEQKSFFGTLSFSALMGVTEPAVFGAFVKYRKPFLSVMISAGAAGLLAGLMNVKAYTFTTIFGILGFIGENDYRNFYVMVAAVAVSFILSVICGYIFCKKENDEEEKKEIKTQNPTKLIDKKVVLASPVKGKRITLKEVKDDAFSSGALGKGLAVVPTEETVYSPVNGEVVTLFPTKHAIGIASEEGVEVLIHIGIDTVNLNGEHFEALIQQGDKVQIGQPLVKVDFDKIVEKGYDPAVIVVVSNSEQYLDVLPNLEEAEDETKGFLSVII